MSELFDMEYSFLEGSLHLAYLTVFADGVLIAYVATKQNVLFGSTLLFVFAMGMNMLLMLIGTFTVLVTALTKSGMWMLRSKKAMGFLIIATGVYFLILAGKVWF
jgi:thiol:disulfide interchange protein DsbD